MFRESVASGLLDSCPMLLLVLLLPQHGQSAFEHRMQLHGKNPSPDATASLDMGLSSSNFDGSPTSAAVIREIMKRHRPDAATAIARCKDYSAPCAYIHLVYIP